MSELEKAAENGENKKQKKKDIHFAYEEMDIAITKMNSGVSETTAIAEFGDRCGIHCYIKLANIIEQNLRNQTNLIGNFSNYQIKGKT